MNFGSGRSNQLRNTFLRRDPELRPTVMNSTRTSISHVTLRTNRRLTDALTVTTPVFAIKNNTRKTVTTGVFRCKRVGTENQEKLICPICFDKILPVSIIKPKAIKCCGYVFCEKCIEKCQIKFRKCPMCNQKLEQDGYLAIQFYYM